MISNFALLLSHEGIKLAHRTPDGWAELGHVSLLDDELSAKLEVLRKQAETLSVTEFSSKIVLPHDQIKYLTLPNVEDDQREDAIKEALERATPYLIDDLVYDWEEGDDGMNVAAVSRDTLSEAESFIVQHGFNPVSFVAAPDDALFSVEPFFGSCSSVAAIEEVADSIEAEVDKVILAIPTEAPMTEAIDDLEALEEKSEETKTVQAEPDVSATEEPLDTKDDPSTDETTETKSPLIAPLVADRDKDLDTASFPMLGPATSTSILGGMEPAVRPAPAIGIGAERDSDVEDRSFPSWAGAAERNAPLSMDESVEPSKVGWLKSGKKGAVEEAHEPPSWMKTDDTEVDDDVGDFSEFEEEQEAAAWVPATMAAPIKQPLYDEVESEADKLEIFGNRGDRDRPAAAWNPLWIGAIVLAVILLIGGSYFGLRYFTSTSEPLVAEVEQTVPVADEITVVEADDVDTAEPTPVELLPTPEVVETEVTPESDVETQIEEEPAQVAEIIETEPVVDLPPVDATTELGDTTSTPEIDDNTSVEAIADTTAHDGATAPEQAPAQPEDEVALETEVLTPPEPIEQAPEILTEAPSAAEMAPVRPVTEEAPLVEAAEPEVEPVAEEPATEEIVTEVLPADLLERAASEWTSLSVEARDARYAATGIWPLAPEAPAAPSGESVGTLFLATIDPVVFATDAFAITAEAEMLSDKALTAVPNPPAPGTRFERDDRGLVAATPEGAVTPDGITIYQGIPPKLPPLAPRPDTVDLQAAQRAALQGKIPVLRPNIEVAADDPIAVETESIVSGMPPLRPASIAALATEPEEIVNPLALDRTPMPRLRPNNIGEIVYNTERATVAAQTTTAVAPSNNTVAGRATETDAISLRGINLIGIYGESGDRRALVRLQSGRYTKIEVGDRLNGGQVTAIDQDRVLYVRNGQTVVLRMPSN